MRQKVLGATSLGQTANELTYNKGEAVLTMFEGWLGRDKFRAGVLEYLKAHEWKNAEGKDLWGALGHASGDNIDAAMSSFLDQAGVPIVSVQPLGGGRVRIAQRRFPTVGEGPRGGRPGRGPRNFRDPGAGGLLTRRARLARGPGRGDLGAERDPA